MDKEKGLEQTADSIWQEYQKGVSYNTALDLYKTREKCENFYIGKQWEGLNAPDLPKPVINVLKRVVSYFISMIVSDDVSASFSPFNETKDLKRESGILSRACEQAIEMCGVKSLCREVVRDAAVCGDGAIYFYFDPLAESGQAVKGKICAEVLDTSCVTVKNPQSSNLQGQEYIIIAQRQTVDKVKKDAERLGAGEEIISQIVPDSDENAYNPAESEEEELCTVLYKFYKEDGRVFAIMSTATVIIREAWDTGYSLYPVEIMRWEKIRNSFHGVSALSAMIPNQIAINQLFAMAIHHIKTMAFPKIIYDATKISAWSNKVGQAIGAVGNPNDAIATGFKAPDMSAQVMQLIEILIQKTLEFMGASDATLGNIKPDNTSAIIATQQSSAMPLELQRMEYFRFTEGYVRIIVDLIKAHYGTREMTVEDEEGIKNVESVNFSDISASNLNLNIDIGPSSYWSELMQTQTLDNLFMKGIISDATEYLERVPDKYLPGKSKLIESLKKKEEAAAPQGEMAPHPSAALTPFPS